MSNKCQVYVLLLQLHIFIVIPQENIQQNHLTKANKKVEKKNRQKKYQRQIKVIFHSISKFLCTLNIDSFITCYLIFKELKLDLKVDIAIDKALKRKERSKDSVSRIAELINIISHSMHTIRKLL